jgi:hypothetical protein
VGLFEEVRDGAEDATLATSNNNVENHRGRPFLLFLTKTIYSPGGTKSSLGCVVALATMGRNSVRLAGMS